MEKNFEFLLRLFYSIDYGAKRAGEITGQVKEAKIITCYAGAKWTGNFAGLRSKL